MLEPLEVFITKLFYIRTKHNLDIKIIAKFPQHQNFNEGKKMLISNLFKFFLYKIANILIYVSNSQISGTKQICI